MSLDFSSLDGAIRTVSSSIDAAIAAERARCDLLSDDPKEAAFAYLERGGKRLRPLLVHLAAGVAGGDPERVASAALAVEVFHTWSLIHDDLIDNDTLRRGGPTVHIAFRDRVLARSAVSEHRARNYGDALAILAGDYLQGLSVRLMLDGTVTAGASPATVHQATRLMQTGIVRDLVEGEVADVALTHRPVDEVPEEDLLDMYHRKSASLIGYCARVGAMLALDVDDPDAPLPSTLATFAERCGIAFQIRDDVLGLVGDQDKLGKPVGSDIREGKRTVALRQAYLNADPADRATLNEVVGRSDATEADIRRAIALIEARGGLEYARRRADQYVNDGLGVLEKAPASPFRDLLADWAGLLIRRDM